MSRQMLRSDERGILSFAVPALTLKYTFALLYLKQSGFDFVEDSFNAVVRTSLECAGPLLSILAPTSHSRCDSTGALLDPAQFVPGSPSMK